MTNGKNRRRDGELVTSGVYDADRPQQSVTPAGRWPAKVILTDPIFDGGVAARFLDRWAQLRGCQALPRSPSARQVAAGPAGLVLKQPG